MQVAARAQGAGLEAAARDVHHRPDQDADHVVEKPAAADVHVEDARVLARGAHVQPEDRAEAEGRGHLREA